MLRRVRVRVRVPCLEPTWCSEADEEGEGGGGVLLEPATAAEVEAACEVGGGGGERGVACGAGMMRGMVKTPLRSRLSK